MGHHGVSGTQGSGATTERPMTEKGTKENEAQANEAGGTGRIPVQADQRGGSDGAHGGHSPGADCNTLFLVEFIFIEFIFIEFVFMDFIFIGFVYRME